MPILIFVKLYGAIFLTLFLPGKLLLERLPFVSTGGKIERWVVAFGLSYVWVTLLCIAITLFHSNLNHAVVVHFLCLASLFFFKPTPFRENPLTTGDGLALFAAGVIGILGWLIEPQIQGEEVIELITIRKMLENPSITLWNVIHIPDTIHIYIFAPYYFLVAFLSKIAVLSHFVVYIKLRSLYAFLSFLGFFSLASWFTKDRLIASASTLGFLVYLFLRPSVQTAPVWLFPFTMRICFSTGVLVPTLMLVTLIGVFTPFTRPGQRWILALPGLIVGTVLMSHALEAYSFFFFVMALLLSVWAFRSQRVRFMKSAVIVTVGLTGVYFAYLVAHYHLVDYIHLHLAGQVTEYHLMEKIQGLLRHPARMLTDPLDRLAQVFLTGEAPELDVHRVPAIYSFALPLVVAPVFMAILPFEGTFLWLALALPTVAFTLPLTYLILERFVGTDASHIQSYAALIGFLTSFGSIALAIRWGLVRLFKGWAAVALAGGVCAVSFPLSSALMRFTCAHPRSLLVFALLAPFVGFALRKSETLRLTKYEAAFPLTACFLIGIFPMLYGLRNSDRPSAPDNQNIVKLMKARGPSVVDWPAYYPYMLQRSMNPPLDIPLATVEDLQKLLPSGKVVAYDPVLSYAIPVAFNVYMAAFDSRPGLFTHIFSSQVRYLRDYVKWDGKSQAIHPIFNRSTLLTDTDLRFVNDYDVRYILVNPTYYDIVNRKLEQAPDRFAKLYDKGQFSLFEVRRKL